MANQLRIVMAQMNFHLGDIAGNLHKHIEAATKARDELSADVIVFPELSLTGYPPEDLLLRHEFIYDANHALKHFIKHVKGIYCVVGHPYSEHEHTYNACSIIYNGEVLGRYCKLELPNYGVFDERRYFTPGQSTCVVPINGIPTGIVICEDLWRLGPTRQTAAQGARLILAPNASPFESNKHEKRMDVLHKRATHDNIPILYVNHVSGQDELVFDGGSMAVNAAGELCQLAGFFHETLHAVDIDIPTLTIKAANITVPPIESRIYQALALGLRDYINKNHFSSVLLGLSGGIDSALTACIAVDALGKDRVKGVLLPSRYTEKISEQDALALAAALGINTTTISIEPAYQALLNSLAPVFSGMKPDITEENLQARCRGTILMALSNKEKSLLLTTGNRSELAVGYCTLYGDMAGGFAVLKDIPKTLIYQLANYRNRTNPVIPQRTIDRPPTAELAPNQTDQDTLPPYSILDAILELYMNQSRSIRDICHEGFDESIVKRVIDMIHKNEYKRSQAAIGIHINHKSFGKDWRYPLTNGFKTKDKTA